MAELSRRRLLGGLAAATAFTWSGLAPGLRARTADAAIYGRIWDADQAGNGVAAIAMDEAGDPSRGFVRVDEGAIVDPDHRLFPEVVIPDGKRATYDLCARLLDQYRLDQTRPEPRLLERKRRMIDLLDAILDLPPMALAREEVGRLRGRALSDEAWGQLVFELWLRMYDDGRNLDLSGFEHIVVGEQHRGTVGGYHFWYKYWLDDHPEALGGDRIEWHGTRYDGREGQVGRLTPQGWEVPEVVTLAFRWHAQDGDAPQPRPLFKPIGGFWVGCSIEGLMALGTVRFFQQGRIEAVLNGARYEVEVHRSPDGQSLRTVFPRFLGLA
jgi:poly(U)-specific endoribonuclease